MEFDRVERKKMIILMLILKLKNTIDKLHKILHLNKPNIH